MAFVRGVDKLNFFMEKTVGIILALMSVVVLLQVLVRFVFEQFSVPWSEELARYLMIWLTFIGSAIATRRAKLIAIDAIVFSLPAKFGKVLKTVAHILSIVFYMILLMIGIEWFQFGFSETAPVLKIPKAYVYGSMFVGAALMILNTLAHLIETFINGGDIRGSINDEEIDTV